MRFALAPRLNAFAAGPDRPRCAAKGNRFVTRRGQDKGPHINRLFETGIQRLPAQNAYPTPAISG